jgi:hypothetical protein
MAKGILIAAMDFSDVAEDEFHDWYDLEHIPERRRVPGFTNAERWIDVKNPKLSIATYDLESIAALTSAPYLAVAHDNGSPWTKRVTARCRRLLRYEGEQTVPGNQTAPVDAVAVLLVAMNVAPEHEGELNEWYDTEHIPALAAVPGTLSARRYRGRGDQRYVALYHFAAAEVPGSAAWKNAAGTPWTERMRPRFRDFLRLEGRRYARAR